MRILVIQGGIDSNLVTGEEVVINNDIKFLQGNGAKVFYEKIKISNSGWRSVTGKIGGLTWSFTNYRKIKKLISKHKPDVVHFHTIAPYLSLSVVFSAYNAGVPIVQTLHNVRWLCLEGGFFRGKTYCDDCIGSYGLLGVFRGCGHGRVIGSFLFVNNYIARRLGLIFKYVDQFIAVSDFVKRTHVQSYFPEDLISVRNNSVDLAGINHAINRKGVTFAGRVSVAKGALLLKRIIPSIKEVVNIVGNGPYLDDLRLFCTQNNYKNVVFWGKQTHEKTIEIIKQSACVVVPSQCGETFSLVAAESIAAGVPVVASNLGGVSDLVNHSRVGIVVAYDNHMEFVKAINEVLNDKNQSSMLRERGLSYVKNNLSHKKQGDALLNIYNLAIKKYNKKNDNNI